MTDYQVMERMRRRVDAIVGDRKTVEALETLVPLPLQAAIVE